MHEASQETTDRYESLDFLTDGTIIRDPYPYYQFLHERRGPVWIEPVHGMAMVTGYEEALTVYRDHETFSSCNAPSGPFSGFPASPEVDDVSALVEQHRADMPLHGYMATWDPPEHTAYRSLLTGLFTPRRLAATEAFMGQLAERQIDEFLERGACELIYQFAVPYTMLVIATLLGVPQEDLPRFRAWFDAQQARNTAGQGRVQVEDLNVLSSFEDAFTSYLEDRRRRPREDVLTHLAQVTFPDGSTPTTTVLANEAAFLFAAGQETTARTLAFAVQYLAEHPRTQEFLREHRDRVPGFVEEILRLESPVQDHFRLARKATTLGGVSIPAGTTVMMMIGAVNRDPRRFDAPDEFSLDRRNSYEHVTFARGVHTCLGQPLARAEARIGLEHILDRMADIRISTVEHGPAGARRYDYDPTSLFRGLKALHVEFTAADRRAGVARP
ncbi:Cytochrome P450 [Parafrankia irregularis]|uniref:Cytochrome P450 n=1 Tax=Parafrankia irregularis TaxID=795642 RepID=A0A0S4QNY8_9ACTN|nr:MULTISPECIES: cytochrome P450 [Parafrankia]MBE3201662.1 cytochrome P450 [Parafrankia sp. CH37]CUU57403.1 Cytochrome P450 [Parafrankia irregularis]